MNEKPNMTDGCCHDQNVPFPQSLFSLILQYVCDLGEKLENPTIVFDLDLTIFPTFPGSRTMNDSVWLYKRALECGYKICFVTARPLYPENLRSTKEQLRRSGLGLYSKLMLMPEMWNKDDISVSEYKLYMRRLLNEDGYDIVLNVGDRWGDIFSLSNPKALAFARSYHEDSFILLESQNSDPSLLALKLPAKRANH